MDISQDFLRSFHDIGNRLTTTCEEKAFIIEQRNIKLLKASPIPKVSYRLQKHFGGACVSKLGHHKLTFDLLSGNGYNV